MILNLSRNFHPLLGKEIEYESFLFSGGEPHIKIKDFDNLVDVQITQRINAFNDLGLLCIAVDALRRLGVEKISLFLPYFPGARQDRVMVPGESLTVKVYADMINNLNLSQVTIFDPHSEVTPALLNNCKVISNHGFVENIIKKLPKDLLLISPDSGAAKKIHQLAHYLNHSNLLECGKTRDVSTGKLSGFKVPADDLNKAPCLIVDDICDGGGTFMGLATALKEKNAGDLYLAVSHGIFSKGIEKLSEIFTKIFTTDSIKEIDEDGLYQVNIRELVNLRK